MAESTKHKKGRKNKESRKVDDYTCLSVVTIQDFADSKGGKRNHLPKSHMNLSKLALGELNKNEEEDENSDDELIILPDSINLNGQDKNITSLENEPVVKDPEKSIEIPLEIWILISDFLEPTDVQTFSLICKSTYQVINTPHFWIRLYKRYYRNIKLPNHLKRHCLERQLGLKANVVRSLFHTYTPFCNLLTTKKMPNVSKVIGLQCVSMWTKLIETKGANNTINKSWLHLYKFAEVGLSRKFERKKKKELAINYNPEARCKIVQLTCSEFNSSVCVIGLKLRKIKYELGRSLVHFQFGPAHLPISSELETSNVYLNLSTPPEVFEWWHPSYYT